ncbi:MAG: hypothetical protein Q7K21_05830, partial [Elusimicrobiota bacterium]|nr:hypothetical protein [Elusimicrobiota bacterium]
TVSFFVLFAVQKTESQGLKQFGRLIAVLLWISAAAVLSMGIFVLSTGCHPLFSMHRQMAGNYEKHCNYDDEDDNNAAEHKMGQFSDSCDTVKGMSPVKDIKKDKVKK